MLVTANWLGTIVPTIEQGSDLTSIETVLEDGYRSGPEDDGIIKHAVQDCTKALKVALKRI